MSEDKKMYEMLLTEHTKYHKMGPKDIPAPEAGAPHLLEVDMMRQTSTTGETISIKCPVYQSDDRETMMNRINMCYSILQERLEDENKAQDLWNKKAQQQRLVAEAERRNVIRYKADEKWIRKEAKKSGWTQEVVQEKLTDLRKRFSEAQEQLKTEGSAREIALMNADGQANLEDEDGTGVDEGGHNLGGAEPGRTA